MKKENREAASLPDYSVYVMKWSEKAMAFIIGFFAGFAGIFALYERIWAAIPAAFLCGFLLLRPAGNYLSRRRSRKLLLQFRDFLDSLQASFSSGKNLFGAIGDTAEDLRTLYGKDEMMVREAMVLREGIRNGMRPEALLLDLAVRSGLDDIRSFADTVNACTAAGGDLRQTVTECREILCDRIAVEQEIAATVSQNRTELYILACLPFAATFLIRMFGNGMAEGGSFSDIAVRSAALALFIGAVLLGKKITEVAV